MLSTDTDILATAEAWREAGRGVALATVIETWGSAPRPVGSHLIIDQEGNFLGSVSGGCVEGAVIAEAADVIEDDGTARPYVSPIGFNGLAFEIGAFGHLEQSLWASLQGVAAQRATEGRESHEGGTDPLELLRYLMMNPEPLVKDAGYLDIATDPRPPGA